MGIYIYGLMGSVQLFAVHDSPPSKVTMTMPVYGLVGRRPGGGVAIFLVYRLGIDAELPHEPEIFRVLRYVHSKRPRR